MAPRQRCDMGRQLMSGGRRRGGGAEIGPVARLAAEDEMARPIVLIEAPIAQGAWNDRTSGKIDALFQRSERVFRANRGDDAGALAPNRHSQSGIHGIAARNAPARRTVREDEIVDAQVSEGGEGTHQDCTPARISVKSMTSEL